MSEAQNGEMQYWTLKTPSNAGDTSTTAAFVKQYYEPYLQVITKNRNSLTAPYTYYYHSSGGELIEWNTYNHYSIVLKNGVYLHFDANYITNWIQVRVDINGKQKPNTIGVDNFYIKVYPEFKMYGEGSNRMDLLRLCKGTTMQSQFYCGALIQYDGWEIKKDYPWK